MFNSYKHLSLQNFRGFKKEEDIPLAALTFVVGPNSSGKSSICNALLLIAQSHWLPVWESSVVPTWIGPLVDLGSFKDAVYGHNVNLTMSLASEISLDPKGASHRSSSGQPHQMRFEFSIRAAEGDPAGRLRLIRLSDSISQESLNIHVASEASRQIYRLDFLGTNRVIKSEAPREPLPVYRPYALVAHEIDQTLQRRKGRASIRGKKAAWDRIKTHLRATSQYSNFTEATQRVISGRASPRRWYPRTGPGQPDEPLHLGSQRVFASVDPALLGDESEGERSRDQISIVLRKLDIAEKISRSDLSPYHFQINVKDNKTKVESRLIDVGYGASQAIPVIIACLSRLDGPLFIEQPEIHLHPRAQGTLAELIANTSKHRQLIVETHSVHMINRVRLMVADGKINHRDVMILYVDRTKAGSRVFPIAVRENGDFGADWPAGFFDERYQDTLALLQIQSNSEER